MSFIRKKKPLLHICVYLGQQPSNPFIDYLINTTMWIRFITQARQCVEPCEESQQVKGGKIQKKTQATKPRVYKQYFLPRGTKQRWQFPLLQDGVTS